MNEWIIPVNTVLRAVLGAVHRAIFMCPGNGISVQTN